MNGKALNKNWQVNAEHALYRASGDWHHQLKRFPGAFIDKSGYVIFETENDYRTCPYLKIKKDVHVRNGIAAIPGYVRIADTTDNQHI